MAKFSVELKKDNGEVLVLEIPQCRRCRHSWWPKKFDWIKGEPKESTWCPCCLSANWDQDFSPGQAPTLEEGVLAYDPRKDQDFISRQTWLDKQAAIRNNEGNPWLPVPIAEKEKAKAAVELLRDAVFS